MVHLVQIMITTDQFSQSVEEGNPSKKETGDFSIVLQMLHEVRDAVGFASDDDGSEGLSGNAVWYDLKNASIPFLRAAAGKSQPNTPPRIDSLCMKNWGTQWTIEIHMAK